MNIKKYLRFFTDDYGFYTFKPTKEAKKEIGEKLSSITAIKDRLSFLENKYSIAYKETKDKHLQDKSFHKFFEFFKKEHFVDCELNPEFTYWFLKYNAQNIFKSHIQSIEFQDKLKSSKVEIRLKGELNPILDIETKANELIENNSIDDYKEYKIKGFLYSHKGDEIKCIEYFRITDNYYKTKPTEHSYNVLLSPEVRAYRDHLLLKPYLEELLSPDSIQFSISEWATIFYYANSLNLLPEAKFKTVKMKSFMKEHLIPTTFTNFRAKYYQTTKRINTLNNYSTKKLETIIPFLKEYFPQTVCRVESDIELILEENPDY